MDYVLTSKLAVARAGEGGDWKIVPDNFVVKVRVEHLDLRSFQEAVAKPRAPGFWEDPRLWAEVARELPGYRLSKFQALMPEWVEREVLGAYLLDVGAARAWMDANRAA